MISPTDSSTMTVRVPIRVSKRGGRKLIITEGGQLTTAPTTPKIDNTLLRAIVQAFRWKALLDTSKFATIGELAAAEKMNTSYVAHVLKLTLLSPDIVESILDGKQARTMQLEPLMRAIPLDWAGQRDSMVTAGSGRRGNYVSPVDSPAVGDSDFALRA